MHDYVVIPDIHNRVKVAEVIAARYPNHIKVFLGDYFDDFGDGPTEAKATAEWLRWSIYQPGRIHLMGNHDLPYASPSIHTMCPGWRKDKHRVVSDVMRNEDWRLVDLVHCVDSPARTIVLSHAGFTLANVYGAQDASDVCEGGRLYHLRDRTPEDHIREIYLQAVNCKQALRVGGNHHWLNQGSRMGKPEAPGPFWTDFSEMDTADLEGIDQIVGHTELTASDAYTTSTSTIWGIDTHGTSWAIIDKEGHITPIYS